MSSKDRTQIRTVERLLREYHDGELHKIGEHSGAIDEDVRKLDADMPVIARNLGSTWHGCNCEGLYYGLGEE